MNRLRVVGLVLAWSSVRAAAQPAVTTPAVVEARDPALDVVAPQLAHGGNLRVSIACAEHWVTPVDGLVVTADGAPVPPRRENGFWSTVSDDDGTSDVWSATDVGYLVAPGHHRVEISAPGCAPAAFELDTYPDHARVATGRLAVDDPGLEGPVGAPNGIGLVLGVLMPPSPPHGTEPGFAAEQDNTYDPGHTGTAGWLSVDFERRHFMFAFDQSFGTAPISGTTVATGSGSTGAPVAFTGHAFDWRSQFRIGTRVPLHDVALEAGSGIGVDMWFLGGDLVNPPADSFLEAPDGVGGGFWFPLWASLTIKPSCDWGVQLLGQYDVHPASSDADGYELGAGLLYQPSASCSDLPGVHVATD